MMTAIIDWILSFSLETFANMAGIVFLLGGITFLIVRFCVHNVDDNEAGMRNWFRSGFYDKVEIGPKVIFKRPGAEVITYSLKPRKKQAEEQKVLGHEFISEPDWYGYPILVKISFILQLRADVQKDGFIKYHQIESSLEKGALMYMETLIDNQIRDHHLNGDADISRSKGLKRLQDDIEKKAKQTLEKHLDAISCNSVAIFSFGLKLDLDTDVRQKMKLPGLQELDNKASEEKFLQFFSVLERMLGLPGMTADSAIVTASGIVGLDTKLTKSIFTLEGLENFKGLLDEKAMKKVIELFQGKGGKK